MKNILLVLLLLVPFRAAFACDPSYPHGIHGHKLDASYSIKIKFDAGIDPAKKDPNPNKTTGEIMNHLLNTLAKENKADFSFNRVDKDPDANLVFRIQILHDEKNQVFLTHIDVYGMGKNIRLFAVNGIAKESEEDPVLRSFAHAISQVYLMIDKGWSCDAPKAAPSEDPKLDSCVGKALSS